GGAADFSRGSLRVLHDGGGETMEFALQIERRLAGLRSAEAFMQLIAPAHRAAERGERRVRLGHDAAPAGEIERERDVIVDRMPAADVDVETVSLPLEASPQVEVLEALRVGEGG